MTDPLKELAPLFYPSSIAVVGASSNDTKYGGHFVRLLQECGFKGPIYPVSRSEKEMFGLRAYAGVLEVPGDVDFAAICIPAKLVPAAVQECLRKGIKGVEIFAAGFAETGPAGAELQQQIKALTGKGMRIIGPNCFGIYCPDSGLSLLPCQDLPRQGGPVGVLSQSGGIAIRIPRRLMGWGVSCSKVVSYGNACDINEVDLLEYLAADPQTKVITAYLEGPRAGPRFLEAARRAARVKPLVVWKAGLTQGGARAVRSHTASLAGSEDVWTAFFRQTGAIRVDCLDDLIDTAVALLQSEGYGPRIGILAGGGAIGVTAADACERNGLSLAALSRDTLARAAPLIPGAGAAAGNPMDLGGPFPTTTLLSGVVEALTDDPNVDIIIMDEIEFALKPPIDTPVDRPLMVSDGSAADLVMKMAGARRKPLVAVMPVEKLEPEGIEIELARRKLCRQFFKSGVPVFLSLERAAKAIGNVLKYKRSIAA